MIHLLAWLYRDLTSGSHAQKRPCHTLLRPSSLLERHFPAPLPEHLVHVIAQQPPPPLVARGNNALPLMHVDRSFRDR